MVSQWLLIEPVRHQVAIAGRVTNVQTNKAMSNVEVMITKAPEAFSNWLNLKALQYGEHWQKMIQRPDRTRTTVDGHFHFLDLPDGQYSLTASMATTSRRYGTAEVTVVISREHQNRIVMATADIALPATTVKGKISDQNGDPVILGEIRVNKSAERAFSNQQGQYLLMGLEASEKQERIILVSAPGYDIASGKVLLNQAGIEKTLDFVLKKRNSV